MLLLIFFAFLAGLVTVLSPCILPVLPIVLSGSVGGGKKKPLGVVTGFVVSFTVLTLFLSSLVQLTGISADALRLVSVIVIAGFGISLWFPRLQAAFEKLFSGLTTFAPRVTGDGWWAGLGIGFSLGLLWTPCVGPILAAVISLALTGSVSGTAALITLAYAVGTGLPMLAITYGGRGLLQRWPWLLQNTGTLQKGFGLIMVVTAVAIALNWDRRFQTWFLSTFPNYGVGLTQLEDNDLVRQQLDQLEAGPPTSPSGL